MGEMNEKLVGKHEGEKSLQRPRHRLEDNIEIASK
jgi:hypothetical protein